MAALSAPLAEVAPAHPVSVDADVPAEDVYEAEVAAFADGLVCEDE